MDFNSDLATASSSTASSATVSTSAKATRRSARSRLLDAAATLFYADGMTATGIDKITAEAGVAKKSLYNNFASKDELVRAYIEQRHEEWLELYRARLAGVLAGKAGVFAGKSGVLAVFDAYLDHAEAAYPHGFRGCGLLNAAAELPAGAPGREAVRRHKEEVESLLVKHLEEAGAADSRGMAEHLSFLLEGAMSRAGLEGQPDKILHARKLAESLLESAAEQSL
ncbi:MAG: TetR/AcrR family transcriptional regulator [Ancrocorticia sp.]